MTKPPFSVIRIRDGKDVNALDFEHVGSTFIIIPKGSKPPYKDQQQMAIPFFALAENKANQ